MRQAGRIVSVAVTIAVGVNADGRREVLGMAIGASKAETLWTDFLRSLARRGLRGVIRAARSMRPSPPPPPSAMTARWSTAALTMLGGAVDQGVRDACNQDLGGLLVKGWSMATELYGYTDQKKYPPTQIVRIALADHPMKIAVDPELSLTMATMPVHKLKLKLTVEFGAEIIAAVLIIQAGAITAFKVGSVRLSAKVLWGSVALPLKLKTRDVTIPGRIRIDPPVAIRKAPPPQDS